MKLTSRIDQIRKEYEHLDHDWISSRLEVRASKIAGKGLYAKEHIAKGELLIVLGGKFVGKQDALDAEREGKVVMRWDDEIYTVENWGEQDGWFINHSCNPNMWMEGMYALTAMIDIEVGEEATVDYAIWYDEDNYKPKWVCSCGSNICRKIITGSDWKKPELQLRYKDHFTPLVNKKLQK